MRTSFPRGHRARRVFVAASALFILLVLPGTSGAATRCVDPAGGPCETTIPAAIAAATTGDTIDVHAGTYTGAVTIDKPLTLRGPNAGLLIDDVRGAEATLTHGFVIGAGNVTIDGFRLAGVDASDHQGAKITQVQSTPVDDVLIRSNLLENFGNYGIRHQHNNMGLGAAADQDHRWTVTDNIFREWSVNNAAAIYLWGVDEALVRRNRIVDTPVVGVTTYGLHMSTNSNSEITDNEITGVTSFGLQLSASWMHVSDVLISGNTMTDTGTGIIIRPDTASYTITNVRILRNELSGQELRSIAFHQSSLSALGDIEIADNVIHVNAARLSDGLVSDGGNRPRFVGAIDLPFNDNASTAHGHVDVRGNTVTFTGTTPNLITPIAISVRGEATSVSITGNVLDGGHVAAGAGATSPPSAVMLYVNEPALAGALDPAAVIQVGSNTITRWENAMTVKDYPAGTVVSPPVGVTVSFTTNLVSDITGYGVQTGGAGAPVVAEDNAWGCDGQIDSGGTCPVSTGLVTANTYLVLAAHAAAPSIPLGGATVTVTADLTRNDNGDLISPPIADGTPVQFATTLGSVPVWGTTVNGIATAVLTPGAATGTATVTVRAGGLVRTVTIAFTPAPVVVAPAAPTDGGKGTGGDPDTPVTTPTGGTAAPATAAPTGGTTTPAKPAKVRPKLTKLRILKPKFRPAARGTSFTKSGRVRGAWVQWHLSQAAPVRMVVVRLLPGRRVGNNCVAPTKGNASRRPCTRQLALRGGHLRVAGKAGANRVRFTGRYKKKALAPGRYILRVLPVGAAARTKPATAAFTIVR